VRREHKFFEVRTDLGNGLKDISYSGLHKCWHFAMFGRSR
jgi:hypothetical protein